MHSCHYPGSVVCYLVLSSDRYAQCQFYLIYSLEVSEQRRNDSTQNKKLSKPKIKEGGVPCLKGKTDSVYLPEVLTIRTDLWTVCIGGDRMRSSVEPL